MALIQDIQPPKKPRFGPPTLQTVHKQVQAFHQATNVPRAVKSFDIIAPGKLRGPHIQRNLHPARAVQQPAPALPKPVITKSPPITKHRSFGRRLLDFAQYPLIAAVAIGAAYSATVGQYMIGLYAVVSIALRVSSQYTFGAALLLLVSIPFFQVIQQSGVSQNAAIYAYELLVVGTLQAVFELFLTNRRSKRTPA